MRIISSFHDYYDCIQKHNLFNKDGILYLREEKILKLKEYPFIYIVSFGTEISSCGLVGFCGRLYPYIKLWGYSRFCLSVTDVDRLVATLSKVEQRGYYEGKRQRFSSLRLSKFNRLNVTKFFEESPKTTEDILKKNIIRDIEEFRRCPIFVLSRKLVCSDTTITYNANLKNLDFVRKIPVAQTFQEIAMFLGNIASPEKPIPKIDDVTMAEAKGFDKYSFRKDPS